MGFFPTTMMTTFQILGNIVYGINPLRFIRLQGAVNRKDQRRKQ